MDLTLSRLSLIIIKITLKSFTVNLTTSKKWWLEKNHERYVFSASNVAISSGGHFSDYL